MVLVGLLVVGCVAVVDVLLGRFYFVAPGRLKSPITVIIIDKPLSKILCL